MTTTEVNVAKQAVHDKVHAQIKTAEAKINSLKAAAENAKAGLELKAITGLLAKKQELQHKLEELKNLDGSHWETAKTALEERIGELEKSVKELESKTKTH